MFLLRFFILIVLILLCDGLNIRCNAYKVRNVIVSSILSSALIVQPVVANTGMITGDSLTQSDIVKTDALAAALKASQKTYSNNAKNIERMSKGDYSMGSKQTSQTERAKKRIATAACKNGAFRSYAKVSEKQCNNRVFDNDYKWVLEGLDEMEAKNNKK
jgi:hypothetical protein